MLEKKDMTKQPVSTSKAGVNVQNMFQQVILLSTAAVIEMKNYLKCGLLCPLLCRFIHWLIAKRGLKKAFNIFISI